MMEPGEDPSKRVTQIEGGITKMVSTSEVLDRHLKSFAEYDVDGLVADYSSDAVLFAPSGPLKGPNAINPLFDALISEFAKPDSQLRCIEGDHAYILWTAETADNWYEFATDTFVVRSGKIIAQSFAAKIKPKH
jgi:SnoaL-like domain